MTRESHLLQALFLAPVDGDDARGQKQGQALLRGPKASAILGDFVGSQEVLPPGRALVSETGPSAYSLYSGPDLCLDACLHLLCNRVTEVKPGL